MVSKDKGDFSNRLNCEGEQLKNNKITVAKSVGVGGGTLLGIREAQKGGKFGKVMQKLTNKCLYFAKDKGILKNTKRIPGKFKAAAPIALLGTLVLGYIMQKTLYKMGQIDQKYTDIAKIEAKQKDVLG